MITLELKWKCERCGEERTYRPYSHLALERFAAGTATPNDRRNTIPESLVKHTNCVAPSSKSDTPWTNKGD